MKAIRHIPLKFEQDDTASFSLTIKREPAEPELPLAARVITIRNGQLSMATAEATAK